MSELFPPDRRRKARGSVEFDRETVREAAKDDVACGTQVIALLLLLLTGCAEELTFPSATSGSSGADLPSVQSLEISPSWLVLDEGAQADLSLVVSETDGSRLDRSGTWSVTDSAVAKLSGTGATRQVNGVSAGTTVVIARVDKVADTATVDVLPSTAGGSGPAVIFDPDRESSTTSLGNDSQGVFAENQDLGASQIFLDTSISRPGGSKSMRYDWVDQGAGNAISIGRKIPIGRQKEVWVEAYVRWSKNFMDNIQLDSNDGDPSTDIAAYKFLFLGATCVTSCNAGWEISDGTKVWRWAILLPGPTRNPPNGPINVETPSIVETDVANNGAQMIENIGHDIAQYFDGQWHKLRIHIRHDPGAYEIWIDGQKVVDLVNQGYPSFTIRPEIATTALLLGRNKDDGNVSGTESLWWGKVSVWTSDPGW